MNEGTNLFRRDWSQTPAGDTFIDLLFNQWWTDEIITSSAEGLADIRAFKGNDTNLEIIGNNITTSIEDLIVDNDLAIVYPNPANNQLTVERKSTNSATIQLFEITGKKVLEQQTSNLKIVLDIGHLKGIYMVKISDATRTTAKKIIIR